MTDMAVATAARSVAEDELAAAVLMIEQRRSELQEVRTYRQHLDDERAKARGRLTGGDASALPDLERMRTEFLDAHQRVQDCENGVHAAEAEVTRLEKARLAADQAVGVEHLRVALDHRSAVVTLVEAWGALFLAAGRLYLTVADESNAIATGLGLAPAVKDPRQAFEYRLVTIIRELVPGLLAGMTHRERSLVVSDAEATKPVRERLAKMP